MGRIGIILKSYPRLSETFIVNELRGLEAAGHRLAIFSMQTADTTLRHQIVDTVHAPVTYPETGWPRIRRLAADNWATLRRHPTGYLRAWWSALKHFYRLAGFKHLFRAAQVVRWAEREQVTHLHAHFAHSPASVAYFAHLIARIPYSISGHAKDIYLTRPAALTRRLARARFMVTCTAANLDYLRQLAPDAAGRIYLVRHGIDVERFVPPFPPPRADHPPLLLSVGRLVEKKGYPDLLRAYKLLRDQGVVFNALIVGSGPLKADIQDLIVQLGLSDTVRLAGSLAQESIVPLYHRAQLFVLAPHPLANGDRDGLPNVLLEAMAARVPIVTTEISGIPEVLTHNRHALLTPPRDPVALAAAIRWALADPQRLAPLIEASFELVCQRFDYKRAIDPFSILLGGPAPAPLPVLQEVMP